MKVVEIPVSQLQEAAWNPNQMDELMLARLKESLKRYGLVQPLVVRPLQDFYEVLSGNQRLKVIQQLAFNWAPCVIVNLKDKEAMLLAQALNNLRGEDDLGMKGALLGDILAGIPEEEVLVLLPETTASLQALTSIGQTELAQQLQAWEQAQAARLKHMQLQFTHQQLETVQEAVNLILPKAKEEMDNPNTRGNAIFLLCKFYLERRSLQ